MTSEYPGDQVHRSCSALAVSTAAAAGSVQYENAVKFPS